MKKSSIQIEPERASLDDFVFTESSMEAAKQHKFQVIADALGYKPVTLFYSTKTGKFWTKITRYFKTLAWVVPHDPPDPDAPVEKAAQDHGVTVGGSGAVGVKDGVVIGSNVRRGNKRGGKL